MSAFGSSHQNNRESLRRPNQIKVFGFGGKIEPLTGNFNDNSDRLKQELEQSLQKASLPTAIEPDSTDINLAIQTGINALSKS